MSILRNIILPALAVAGTAAAQCSTAATATIQSQGDASALASCSVFSGSIAVATGTTGSISLDGVQQITGSLVVNDAVNLTSLEADSLSSIGAMFSLSGDIMLSTLNFPRLQSVNSISWSALPALQQLSFTTQVQTASQVLITNTFLTSLDGINLKTVDQFNINNNQYLKEVVVQLTNVTSSLNIEANGRNLTASFPNLQTASNMTFRNCSDVLMPSLATVDGYLILDENFLTNFAAPNLTSTGGSLVFVGNSDLTNISLPILKTINGGYQIANNTALDTINGFQNLQVIAGALDFSGNFTNVSLPALTDVRGGFNMQSSGDITNSCNTFATDHSNSVIKGTYVCSGKVSHPGTSGSGTSTASGSTPSSTKKSAAGRFEVKVVAVVGLSTLIAGFLHLLS
ncbi:MAG: hypothetical protein M1827_005403 [Pycnora praestabilis]|nr:MAG: hypothetical protein M1827_005403 [Pycnora praestabilis]